MIFDAIENSRYYENIDPNFEKAFEFLKETDFTTISEDKIEIDGDEIFAMINRYSTKKETECKWERHEKYVDIQYMVKGTENIGFVLSDYLDIEEDYNEEKDCEILSGEGDYVQINEGEFTVFFPDDAHMPGIAVDQSEDIIKVVVKVKIQ